MQNKQYLIGIMLVLTVCSYVHVAELHIYVFFNKINDRENLFRRKLNAPKRQTRNIPPHFVGAI